MNSCTVTKRVHRKGWHISWNKNYKSSNTQNDDSSEHASVALQDANQQGNISEIESTTSSESLPEQEIHTSRRKKSSPSTPTSDAIDAKKSIEISSHPQTKNNQKDELPQEIEEEKQDVREVPVGGAFIFLGLFLAVAIGLFALGAFEFAVGALVIAIAAIIIIAHVNAIRNGKTNAPIRPRGFYNSILFLVLCGVVLAYLIIYGGLGELIGLIGAGLLLLIIALLIFLIYQTKDLSHAEVQKKKTEKKETEEKETSPEKKRKNRIAAIVVGGLAVALFLAIALLSN
ncbi:MAG: hypothetical protein NXI10_04495 [bacterium]|nr:hypothetical protein [bacterium]